eukprot:tig00000042_g15499.t1
MGARAVVGALSALLLSLFAARTALPDAVQAEFFERLSRAVGREPVGELAVDAQRLMRAIEELSAIGLGEDGGVTRVAYSDEDLSARQRLQGWMHELGMVVSVDDAGNIIGRWHGLNGTTVGPAIALGSHADTVPSGGRYDGALGVLAGLEVVRALQKRGQTLRHPVEVIVFNDEESTMLGSKAMAGLVDPRFPELYRSMIASSCTDMVSCLKRLGGSWPGVQQAKRGRAQLAAFVELHVEQGPVLEAAGAPVGVVTGIVHTSRFLVRLRGRADHAGTTPMGLRADALAVAAEIVLAVEQVGREGPVGLPGSDQVATVGALRVSPNATNVVPGACDLTIDLRDLDEKRVKAMASDVERRAREAAARRGVSVTFELISTQRGVAADKRVVNATLAACRARRVACEPLPSRAGHDAQNIGQIPCVPTGMVFVRSTGGASHSPREHSSEADIRDAANVLLSTVLLLDEALSIPAA